MKKADVIQQELIDRFYKEETTWCPEHVGYHLVAAIFIGISMLLGIMPYQVWDMPQDNHVIFLWMMLYAMGVMYYVQRYTNYTEGRKTRPVYEVMRYLPVCTGQLQRYIMRKVIRLCAIVTVAVICCQTVCAVAFMHTFSMINILLPLGVNFLLPVVAVWGFIVFWCK